jgi:non-homologous end-joining factor 1
MFEKMKDYVVFPLLSMVGELQRRQDELFKILKKKDYEIQEYKNTGAVLSRSK